jgi:hypothetical protein
MEGSALGFQKTQESVTTVVIASMYVLVSVVVGVVAGHSIAVWLAASRPGPVPVYWLGGAVLGAVLNLAVGKFALEELFRLEAESGDYRKYADRLGRIYGVSQGRLGS